SRPICNRWSNTQHLWKTPTNTSKLWNKLILLSVYYESKCPDSRAFVLQQLQPALQLLHEHIMLQLVPYGKSKSINYGDSGFKCQHGPAECLGNMVQDCALYQMRHLSDLDKLEYVACEMAIEAGARGSMECVKKSRLQGDQVAKCLRTRQGVDLQLDSEYLTLLIRPKFIPTVTVDALFDQKVQDNALADLTGTLCAMLQLTHACAQYYNALAMRHILAYPIDAENLPIYITSKKI
ncbi:GILT-like protein 1, partial [Choristoneura fumiferana]|uniref:GILT-like protein 1 n=1 Tax=Choristoneura fumiferana TaxID=7141 RepID=UPI003D15E573